MATLQLRNESYRVLFCYLGKRHTFTLGNVSAEEADTKSRQVDYLLLRLKQKLIEMPPGVGIEDFLLCDGQIKKPEQIAKNGPTFFKSFKDDYLKTHRNGVMEDNSLATIEMHLRHFERTLGERFPLQELTLGDLQRHVGQRGKKIYRGKQLSPVTLRKEVASFRAAWNWAAQMGLVKGAFPSRGLVYPKTDEKPPYMTWAEVERRLTPELSAKEKAELWDCLYLTLPEIEKLLALVKRNAGHGWIAPLFAFAAHTGARRSEMLRVLVSDVDLKAQTVVIREKKRSRKQRTTRRVPLTPLLAQELKKWLAIHPGGPHLFCQKAEVMRSKTKREAPTAITRDEAHDHFKRTLAGTKWGVIRGWHIFRHSFISLCASKGTDQRLIDEWVGHQTEEQRKRYRHLLPSTQQQAIRSVFERQ